MALPDQLVHPCRLLNHPCCLDVCCTAVVAPDWLASFSPDQRRQLFISWFDQSPAAALLTALVR